MKITVFGGGGFIGSHLVEYLINENYEVTAIDINSEKISADCLANKNFTFVNMDIYKSDGMVGDLIKDSDAVFNLIAYAVPALYIEKPLDVVDLNFFENLKIVKQCLEQKKWIIQFSSCEVYGLLGGRNGIFSEESSLLILGPVNKNRWIYSCAKQLLERIIYAYGEEENLKYTIVRPFNFIGPNMDFLVKSRNEGIPRVFANFMSSLLYKEPMYIVDGGANKRTFVYIRDAVEAMGAIVKNKENFENKIVNIGNPGNEISMKNLALLMRKIYKKNIPGETVPEILSIAGDEYYGEGYQDSE
ncbi:MAG: NAD-dependent epimerase/dehydratase family protein, partial [Actinobacteria bacterium]|nr:NAD-dependent epimerase/dehydratase family protein [Actinomycetota bacterium]